MTTLTPERRGGLRRLVSEHMASGARAPNHYVIPCAELLALLDAAESKPVPHPTLQEHIDELTRWEQALQSHSESGAAIRAVLTELHSLRAILADKIEESCAADEVRRKYRRDVAAFILAWGDDSPEGFARRIMAEDFDGVSQRAARGDLAPYYARVDAMASGEHEKGETVTLTSRHPGTVVEPGRRPIIGSPELLPRRPR